MNEGLLPHVPVGCQQASSPYTVATQCIYCCHSMGCQQASSPYTVATQRQIVFLTTSSIDRDCEGRMYLWDASTRQLVGSLAAHDKRIWALDFTPGVSGTDAAGGGGSHLLASGSDDHLLKV